MSISVYSYIDDENIINTEIKEEYDILQVNKDNRKEKFDSKVFQMNKLLAAKDNITKEEMKIVQLTNKKIES